MGLTIHYDITTDKITDAEAVAIFEKMYLATVDRTFLDVFDFYHVKGDDVKTIDFEMVTSNFQERLMLSDVSKNDLKWEVDWSRKRDEMKRKAVDAKEFYYFAIDVAEGSEILELGLATSETGEKRTWYCSGFCKTHYAKDVSLKIFLMAHTEIIKLFRTFADIPSLNIDVYDEGDFWQLNSIPHLIKQITSDALNQAEIDELTALFA